MDRRDFLGKLTAGSVGLGLAGCSQLESVAGRGGANGDRDRPNILVIMADDMGFSDAGCYGGEIDTPNIDRLAEGGLQFTQFYNASRCCPTRASLLTGQYPHSVNMAENGQTLGRNGLTIAEGLQPAGYDTSMFGKWHLSRTEPLPDEQRQLDWLNHQLDPDQPFASLDSYPVNRGFDEHYGPIWGVVDYFDPFSLVDGTESVADAGDDLPDDYYITDALSRRSADAVRRSASREQPFFMYLAYTAPHWPLHAREEDIDKYRGRYDDGWDALRRERFERQKDLGLFGDEATLPPVQDGNAEWDALSDDEQQYMAEKMAVHAAMVDQMDQGIGSVIDALEETGQLDNTLILFLSDNGASPETPKDWGPGYDRPSETREGEEIQYRDLDNVGPETTFAGIGPAWASASNTPFRYWKAEQYEGGAHTPMIAHWPDGGIEAGGRTDQQGHVMDVLPTCLDLAGAGYPDEYDGRDITPLAGRSLAPILQGQQRRGHERLFFEHVGGKAVIEGKWKLVSLRPDDAPWRLYNLAEDPTETNDLSGEYPGRTRDLKNAWQAWAESVGVPGA
jgi:arylsulfatase